MEEEYIIKLYTSKSYPWIENDLLQGEKNWSVQYLESNDAI